MRISLFAPFLIAVIVQDAPPPPVQEPPGTALLKEAVARMESGGDAMELMERAIASFDGTLKAEPARGEALIGRGDAKLRRGRIAEDHGEEPEKFLAEALADFQKAVELDPKSAPALAGRGEVRAAIVQRKRLVGDDVPRGAMEGPLEDLTKAIELDPKRAASYAARAFARQQAALMRFQQYKAFDAAYPRAIEDFNKAVELEPERGWRWFQRGEAWFLLGVHLGYRREDARPTYKKAVEDYQKAKTLEPGLEPLIRPHLKAAEVNVEGGPPAPDVRPGRSIVWAKSWDLASRESKARNVPVWIYISGGVG